MGVANQSLSLGWLCCVEKGWVFFNPSPWFLTVVLTVVLTGSLHRIHSFTAGGSADERFHGRCQKHLQCGQTEGLIAICQGRICFFYTGQGVGGTAEYYGEWVFPR